MDISTLTLIVLSSLNVFISSLSIIFKGHLKCSSLCCSIEHDEEGTDNDEPENKDINI